jgi:hypothetical protein
VDLPGSSMAGWFLMMIHVNVEEPIQMAGHDECVIQQLTTHTHTHNCNCHRTYKFQFVIYYFGDGEKFISIGVYTAWIYIAKK